MNYAKHVAKYDAELDTARISEVEEEKDTWLWNELIPRGAITALTPSAGVRPSATTSIDGLPCATPHLAIS